MRLSLILFFNKRPIMPYRFRGKNRIVGKPTLHDLLKMKIDFEREEQNMLILRHPYLTPEQSYGHVRELRNKQIEFHEKIQAERVNEFSKQITIADRLNHMKVTEAWD